MSKNKCIFVSQKYIIAMITKEKNIRLKQSLEKKQMPKMSKTWLAMLNNKGAGKIVDMRAVLK